MSLLHILILSLATWRISSLLVNEDGPNKILNEFRELVSDWTGLFDCVWCLSVHVGIILTVAYFFFPLYAIWIMLPFALSAGAILIDRVING